MIMESLDGRLLVSSASDPRYALHSAKLADGTRLSIKEDLWQTREFQEIGAALGDDPVIPSPRFYVTKAYSSSGQEIDLVGIDLPPELYLSDRTIVRDYSLPQ